VLINLLNRKCIGVAWFVRLTHEVAAPHREQSSLLYFPFALISQ
jgi:hypothetical protein